MRIKLLLSTLILSAATTVQAGNLNFLTDTVVSEFTPEDASSFKDFVGNELKTLADKESAQWHSSSTKLQGIVKPQITFEQDGTTCRQTRFALKGKNDRKMFFTFDVCKQGEKWKIVESPLARFKKEDWNVFETELADAMNEGQDGHPVSWSIRRIGVTGTIVPLNNQMKNKQECRDAAISVADSKGHTSNGRYEFCKVDGLWTRSTK